MINAKKLTGLRVTHRPKFIGMQYLIDLSVNHKTDKHTPTNTYLVAVRDPRTGKMTYLISHNTVSLLANVAPGCHFPMSRHYIRRVRVPSNFPLLPVFEKAGYPVEPCHGSEKTTVVVSFYMTYTNKVRTQKEVSMWEKLALTSTVQKHWADNQVSVTITFDPEKEGDHIAHALNYFQYLLKSVSFLPMKEYVFPQMPYEDITEEQYYQLQKNIKPIDLNKIKFKNNAEVEQEKDAYCDKETCIMQGS